MFRECIFLLPLVMAVVPDARAVTSLDEDASPGTHALRFKKAFETWGGGKGVAFDGSVKDRQTGSRYYDRRVAGGAAFGFEQPWSSELSFRLDLRGETVMRRQQSAVVPETITDDTYIVGRPSADMTYITPAGLEIFGGGMFVMGPAHTQKISAAALNGQTKYSSYLFLVPRIGLTRRGGFAVGGVYYQVGRHTSHKVTKESGDGSYLVFDDTLNEPTTAALFAEFNAGGMNWSLEVAAVSGSEGGDLAANGTTMTDDYLRASLGASFGNIFKAQLSHQTASYAKSAYMSLDNIPLSSLRLMVGDAALGIWTGIAYIYGRDRQSIPEVNADYKVDGLVLFTGVNHAL